MWSKKSNAIYVNLHADLRDLAPSWQGGIWGVHTLHCIHHVGQ